MGAGAVSRWDFPSSETLELFPDPDSSFMSGKALLLLVFKLGGACFSGFLVPGNPNLSSVASRLRSFSYMTLFSISKWNWARTETVDQSTPISLPLTTRSFDENWANISDDNLANSSILLEQKCVLGQREWLVIL